MPNDLTREALETEFGRLTRAAASDGSQPATTKVLLHIGHEHLVVLGGHGDRPESVQQIDLGSARVARDFLRHDPPTSREIELAIDFAEDEIMRLGKPVAHVSVLHGTSPWLRTWYALSDSTITIEIVERWFQQLASVSLGAPGAYRRLPAGRDAAATLLVLREFMHHRGHHSIVGVL